MSDEAKAAFAEQADKDHVVMHRGVEFHLPAKAEMVPGDAIEAMEDDKVVSFIRAMVGPDKFGEWKRSFAPERWLMSDLNDLSAVIGKPYGFKNAGESSASSNSSSETSESSRPSGSVTTAVTSDEIVGVPSA